MKRYIILILCLGMCTVFLPSCLKSYLDKAPDSGLTEKDVFSKYENFKKFFEDVYGGSTYNIQLGYALYFDFWDQKYTIDALTDMSDAGRLMESQTIKAGSISSIVDKYTYDASRRPIFTSMWKVIRICNLSLQNIHMLKDADQVDIDDYTAQAHFVRAFAHFTLFKWWGRMPYLTKALGPDDQWDMPRLSNHETLMKIAADLDTAAFYFAKAGKMRRDNPDPIGAGHLNNPDLYKPNGCTALALKGRVLLYAASPLNNELGAKDWENAAKANWEALQTAEQNGYFLLSAANYTMNYVNTRYSDEEIWAWTPGNEGYNAGGLCSIINGVFASSPSGNSGECPTQNTVDKFETIYGEPLNTDADRQAAAAAGHYNEQDPYTGRDPRFYMDIIYNTAPIPGYTTAQIYYQMQNGAPKYSTLLDHGFLGITHTGYYERKLWGGQSVKNALQPLYTDPIIRLAELYLNYAEAANEAYGPNVAAPGATMTAVDAINKIRARVGMPGVLAKYTTSTDVFRPRVKNERTVELCFEGHYYFDIRRWKDAPTTMAGPLMGMDIEKVTTSATYPTGYKYTRLPLTSDRQSHWKDAMYYLPFEAQDMYKMKKFVPNIVW